MSSQAVVLATTATSDDTHPPPQNPPVYWARNEIKSFIELRVEGKCCS